MGAVSSDRVTNPPRRRTDGGGIIELSSWQRADLQLVGLAEAENDRRAEFKGSS